MVEVIWFFFVTVEDGGLAVLTNNFLRACWWLAVSWAWPEETTFGDNGGGGVAARTWST